MIGRQRKKFNDYTGKKAIDLVMLDSHMFFYMPRRKLMFAIPPKAASSSFFNWVWMLISGKEDFMRTCKTYPQDVSSAC